MWSGGLTVANDTQGGTPEDAQQGLFLHDLKTDHQVVAEPDSREQFLCLLKEIDRTKRKCDRQARGEVVIAARTGTCDEPVPLSQRIHRSVHLADLHRGLSQDGEDLRPPHQIGLMLQILEQPEGSSHRFAVAAQLLKSDALQVPEELGGRPVAPHRVTRIRSRHARTACSENPARYSS